MVYSFLHFFEERIEIKRAFLFALLYGYDNSQIDAVRAIANDKLNTQIRKINLSELLEHKANMRIIEKRWNFPYPSIEYFNGDSKAKHIAVIGKHGAGKSEIVRQVNLLSLNIH